MSEDTDPVPAHPELRDNGPAPLTAYSGMPLGPAGHGSPRPRGGCDDRAGAGLRPHAKAPRGRVRVPSRVTAGRSVPLQLEDGGLGFLSAVEVASRAVPCDPLHGRLAEPAEG